MLKSMEEIRKVELPVGGVINGVDNANLMSVDSIEPITSAADSTVSEEDPSGIAKEEKEEKKVEKEAKAEVSEGKTEEEIAAEAKAKAEVESKAEGKTEAEIEAEAEAEVSATAEAADAEKKAPVERRIGQLTKRWRTAERALSNEQAKRKEAETELKKLQAIVPDTEKPVKVDFESDDEYIEALTDWKIDNRFKVQQADTTKKTDDDEELQTIAEVEEELEETFDRGREKYDDYDAVVFAKDLIFTQEMTEVILTSDIAEEIFYYLGNNPEKSADLSEMSAFKAAKEIGKLEVELLADIPKPNAVSDGKPNDSKEVKGKPKKASKAPAPIDIVKATGITEKDPANMSPKEYRQWRESNKE